MADKNSIALLASLLKDGDRPDTYEEWAEKVLAAVKPIIRAQAFREAARVATGYERVISQEPPMRFIIDGKEYETPGSKIVDRTGCDDIAAAILALIPSGEKTPPAAGSGSRPRSRRSSSATTPG